MLALDCDLLFRGAVARLDIVVEVTPIRNQSILVHRLGHELGLAGVDLVEDFRILPQFIHPGQREHPLKLLIIQDGRNTILCHMLNFARFILVLWPLIFLLQRKHLD